MSSPWVAILRNPISGSGGRARLIDQLCTALREHDLRPELFSSRSLLEAAVSEPAERHELVALVAAGGDGTIAEAVNRFPGIPLALLPMGNENLMAKYLGIPASGRAVADIIAAGITRRLDLGVMNGRKFGVMASIGFDAQVIHVTHAQRRGHVTRWTYIPRTLHALAKYPHPEFQVHVPELGMKYMAKLAMILNMPQYALGLPVAANATPDDGQLDVRLFHNGSWSQMLRYLSHVAMGRHDRLPDVTSFRASQLEITSTADVPIQVDGDPAGFTPATITVEPEAFEVFVNPVSAGAVCPAGCHPSG